MEWNVASKQYSALLRQILIVFGSAGLSAEAEHESNSAKADAHRRIIVAPAPTFVREAGEANQRFIYKAKQNKKCPIWF